MPSALEVYPIRLWARYWPFKWAAHLPNRVLARLMNVGVLGPTWLEFAPGLWMQSDVRDLIQETLLEGDVWDPAGTQYICGALKQGSVFLDIGANAGYFSLLAGKRVGPAGKVLAVEPSPEMAEQLRRNAARSGLANIVVDQVACSDSPGTRRLYLGPPSNTGGTSLSERNVKWKDSVDVVCTHADALVRKHALSRVDLVKIDVEGAEHEVLRGMKRLLKELRPIIIMELIEELLRSFSTTITSVTGFLEGFDYAVSSLGEHSNYVCVPRGAIAESGGRNWQGMG